MAAGEKPIRNDLVFGYTDIVAGQTPAKDKLKNLNGRIAAVDVRMGKLEKRTKSNGETYETISHKITLRVFERTKENPEPTEPTILVLKTKSLKNLDQLRIGAPVSVQYFDNHYEAFKGHDGKEYPAGSYKSVTGVWMPVWENDKKVEVAPEAAAPAPAPAKGKGKGKEKEAPAPAEVAGDSLDFLPPGGDDEEVQIPF